MEHEAFYSTREYVNERLGLYVAWTGHQTALVNCLPIISKSGNSILIFQGENFWDREMPARVNGSGAASEDSGLAYLLEQYEHDENEMLRRLNGWFCGIVADLRRNTVTLFNDRFGMNRIYFHEGKDEFLFGSEAKSLLKIRPELRQINVPALSQYLCSNCVMGNKTFFDKIELLPQAASWTFENGALAKKQRYFQFKEWEELPQLAPNEFYSKFTEIVSDTFPKYTKGPEKVAMSLTAGLDTRVIMAALQGNGHTFPCYTFGGTWGETFDISTARKVANLSGQTHEAIRIDEGFFKRFGDFVRRTVYISDGTHDAFGAHDLYFNQLARPIAPIRLTGKFGSEVVRIRRMIPWNDFDRSILRSETRDLIETAPRLSNVSETKNILTRAVSEEIPWFEYGRIAIEQSQVVLRTPYMDNDLVKLMYQAPTEIRSAGNLQALYVKQKDPPLSDVLTNLSKSANHNRVVSALIYYSFWSLFKLEYIYLFATPHWATRVDHWLRGLRLERILAGRQKFEAYRIWVPLYLGDFVRETLLDSNAKYTRYFERASVEKMVKRHLAGTHNYLDEINKLLTIELIHSSLLNP
jgi:asparagine synthase (glutamine-hydrolysing)